MIFFYFSFFFFNIFFSLFFAWTFIHTEDFFLCFFLGSQGGNTNNLEDDKSIYKATFPFYFLIIHSLSIYIYISSQYNSVTLFFLPKRFSLSSDTKTVKREETTIKRRKHILKAKGDFCAGFLSKSHRRKCCRCVCPSFCFKSQKSLPFQS